jgi:iron complex transport system ATP-binding protein
MMENKTSYLSTHNLSIGYKVNQQQNYLFEKLNLSLYAGELVCFMGPNGIGKSSLIRTLSGIQKPLSGKINIPLSRDNATAPKQISIVLTDRISSVNMTVYEVVTFGRYPYLEWNVNLHKSDLEIIEKAFEQVHIHHLKNKKLFELSDGQLQMVMIARALAQDTPIILLDEPTAHLDLNNRVEIMNLLRNLSRTTKKAILIATHELDLALQTADLIWLTGNSKNILTGLPEDLVLDGSFDDIFQFKGFDLKTGKVQHEPFRKTFVRLEGEGHALLWTKNALERSGFEIAEAAEIIVTIIKQNESLQWRIKKGEMLISANSIDSLIKSL